MHILIAEDAPDVAEVVAFSARLTWPDATVTTAGGGAEALAVFAAQPADLVILDVNMPPPDGYAVCQQLRERSDVPILMLTVRDSIVDKMRGFDLGVDDYLTKPFDHLELMARMRALMRRATTRPVAADALAIDGITFDETTRIAVVQGRPVTLTSTEARLLRFLMQHAGDGAAAPAHARGGLGRELPPRHPLPEGVRASAAPEARRRRGLVALHPDRVGRRLPLRGTPRAGVRGRVPARHVLGCGTSPATGSGARSMKRWA